MSRRQKRWLAVCSLLWFAGWHLFTTSGAWADPTHTVPGFRGDNLCMLWNLGWMRYAVQQGHLGFWCNSLFYPDGFFFLFSTHTWLDGFLGSLAAPLLPNGKTGPVLWYNIMQLVATVGTGFFAMGMLRQWGVKRWSPRLMGASLVAFCWFRGHAIIGHQHFFGTEWMMGAMWALSLSRRLLLARRPAPSYRWAAVAGGFLGLAFMNDQTLTVFGLLLSACILVTQLFGPRRTAIGRILGQGAFLLAGFLLIGGLHLVAIGYYWGRFKYYVSDLGRARNVDLTSIFLPGDGHIIFGNIMKQLREKHHLRLMGTPYIGFVGYVFIFALIRELLVGRHRRGPVRILSCPAMVIGVFALLFLVFTMGEYLSIGQRQWFVLPGRVLRYIPVINNIRLLYRWIWPFFVCLSIAGTMAFYLIYAGRWRTPHSVACLLLAAAAAIEGRWYPLEVTNFFSPLLNPPGLVKQVQSHHNTGSVLTLPPDEWYRTMLLSYLWGYDIPVTTGISARAPFNVLDPPWKGRAFSPGAAEYITSKNVRTVVILWEDPELWRDWIKGARATRPDIIFIDEQARIVR